MLVLKKKNTFVNISKRKFSNVSTLLQLLGYSLFTYFIYLSESSLRQFYFCHISVCIGSCNCSVLPNIHWLTLKHKQDRPWPLGKYFAIWWVSSLNLASHQLSTWSQNNQQWVKYPSGNYLFIKWQIPHKNIWSRIPCLVYFETCQFDDAPSNFWKPYRLFF